VKTIEEHNKEAMEKYRCNTEPVGTGVQCPHCGSEMICKNPNVQLLTYPPQKHVDCYGCGYKTTLFV
jgi:hypothetical protein